jgi:hypothetical protein
MQQWPFWGALPKLIASFTQLTLSRNDHTPDTGNSTSRPITPSIKITPSSGTIHQVSLHNLNETMTTAIGTLLFLLCLAFPGYIITFFSVCMS